MEVKSTVALDRFLQRAAGDENIQSWHFCIFLALYQLSPTGNLGEPFFVNRRKLMEISKIRSTSTYHRRMKELVSLGLISYMPSYNPFTGSTVVFLDCRFPLAVG